MRLRCERVRSDRILERWRNLRGAGMNCREFEARWNDLLDSRVGVAVELEARLAGHAEACERCRPLSESYGLLRRAISARRPGRRPSLLSVESLAARIVPVASPTIARRPPRLWRRGWVTTAASALIFAMTWQGGGTRDSTRHPGRPESAMTTQEVPATPLAFAMTEASEATIDLALEASAPASRIGREVFELGTDSLKRSEEIDAEDGTSDPSSDPPAVPSNVFRAVGQRVGAGVRPISESARQAFGFLFRPANEAASPPDDRRQSL